MVLLLIYTPIAEQYTTLCLEGKHQKWTKRRSRTGLRLLLRCYPLCRNPSREGLTLGLTPRAIKWRGKKGLSWESQKLHRISPFPASAPPCPHLLPPKSCQLSGTQQVLLSEEGEMPQASSIRRDMGGEVQSGHWNGHTSEQAGREMEGQLRARQGWGA